MAKAFNLTAQINLQGPANIKPVVAQIKRELGSVKPINVKLNLDTKAGKSIDNITSKLQKMNSVLLNAKTNVDSLSSSFTRMSSALGSSSSVSSKTAKGLQQVAQTSKAVGAQTKIATNAIQEFGKQTSLAAKRFTAFTIGAGAIFGFVNAINSGFKSFLEFDRQLVRLQQVTGAGTVGIQKLSKSITNLAVSFGISSNSLAETAVTLAQAGFTASQTEQALTALAKTELAPSFDNITQTTEGAIAAIRQFGLETSELESALGSINAVAAAFAVESSDIISAIQRTGGVFASASAGVSEGTDALNEFIAVFTSVRATTRESAETIATGLRTIFTRIQRGSTIEYLKQFNIELQDSEGKFVGAFEAIKRLSEGLEGLDTRDVRFNRIVEELGGFRQIGKVIPLIQQFSTAQDALSVAQRGQNSLTEATAKAQQSLLVQIAKVREEFLALIRTVADSSGFRTFLSITLSLTSGLIKLANVFKPILPILAILGAVKGVSAIGQFASGFAGSIKKGGGAEGIGQNIGGALSGAKEKEKADATSKASEVIKSNTTAINSLTTSINKLIVTIDRSPSSLSSGGKILGFNSGGVVPGSGKGDKVPALLEPGEVVMSNRTANKYGRGNLVRMNKYAAGGQAKIASVNKFNGVYDGDTIRLNVTPTGDAFDTRTRLLNVDAFEITEPAGKKNSWQKQLGLRAKNLADQYYRNKSNTDIKNTISATQGKEKFGRYLIEDNQLANNIKNLGLGTDLSTRASSLTKESYQRIFGKTVEQTLKETQQYKYLGGQIQKFNLGGKGRGKPGPRGARRKFKELSESEIAKLTTQQLLDYAKAQIEDIFTSGGSGMAVGSEFIEVPESKIIKELESDLTTYLGKRGFWREIVSPFQSTKTKDPKQRKMDSRTLRRMTATAAGVDASALKGISLDKLLEIAEQSPRATKEALEATVARYESDPEFRKITGMETGIKGGFLKQFEALAKQGQFISAQPLLDSIPDAEEQLKAFRKTLEKELAEADTDKLKKSINDKIIKTNNAIQEAKQYREGKLPSVVGRVSHFAWAMRQAIPEASSFANGGTIPAMVSNGEAFVPPDTAKSIGYANLDRMNQADRNGMTGFSGGGVSIFKGAGSGTSDSIGPIGLPVGGYVIREKATKALGLSKGGPTGFIQKFNVGGRPSSFSGPDPQERLDVFIDAAAKAGKSLDQFAKELKNRSLEIAQANKQQRETARADIKTTLLTAKAKGFGNASDAEIDKVVETLRNNLLLLSDGMDPAKVEKAVQDLTSSLIDGEGFSQLLDRYDVLQQAMDNTTDSARAVAVAEAALADEFGGLINSVRSTAKDLEAKNYIDSGQAEKDFGLLGKLMPNRAFEVSQTEKGKSLTDFNKRFSETLGFSEASKAGKAFGGLNKILQSLPGPIGRAAKSIGGLPVAFGAIATLIGTELVPSLNNFLGLGDSVFAAGIGGALAEGGSKAASYAAIGQQILPGIGTAIGAITGALEGAITGFINASKTKALSNALETLEKNTLAVDDAFKNLSKLDNKENLRAAYGATGGLLQSNAELNNLGGFGTKANFSTSASNAAKFGAIAGGITAAGLAIATFSTALAPFTAGLSLLAGGVIVGAVAGISSVVGWFTAIPDAIDNEAFEAARKNFEKFYDSVRQLAERDLSLKSLNDINKQLDDINAKRPGSNPIIESAQLTALTAEFGDKIDPNASLQENLRGLMDFGMGTFNRGVDITQRTAKETALGRGSVEILRQAGGDVKLARKREQELGPAEVARLGQNLIDAEGKQLVLIAQQNALLKQVNLEAENLTRVFSKINDQATKFGNDQERLAKKIDEQAALSVGEGKLSRSNRRNEEILQNIGAYSEEEFAGAISQVQQTGADPRLLDALKAQRQIETRLPDLLADATKQDSRSIANEIQTLFVNAGISKDSADQFAEEVFKTLDATQSNRQGKSFQELLDEFPALKSSMASLQEANKAGSNLLKTNNDQYDRVIEKLEQYSQALDKSREYTLKAAQARIQTENDIRKALGEDLSLKDLNRSFNEELKSLTKDLPTGPTTDINIIAREFDKVADKIKDIGPLENLQGDERKAAQQLIQSQNNARKAMELIANDTTRASNALQKFQNNLALRDNVVKGALDILTATPEQGLEMVMNLKDYTDFMSGNLGASEVKNSDTLRRSIVSGSEQVLSFLGNSAMSGNVRAEMTRRMLEMTSPGALEMMIPTGEKDEAGKQIFKPLKELITAANFEDPNLKFAREFGEQQAKANEALSKIYNKQANDFLSSVTTFDNATKRFAQTLQDMANQNNRPTPPATPTSSTGTPQSPSSSATTPVTISPDQLVANEKRNLQDIIANYDKEIATLKQSMEEWKPRNDIADNPFSSNNQKNNPLIQAQIDNLEKLKQQRQQRLEQLNTPSSLPTSPTRASLLTGNNTTNSPSVPVNTVGVGTMSAPNNTVTNESVLANASALQQSLIDLTQQNNTVLLAINDNIVSLQDIQDKNTQIITTTVYNFEIAESSKNFLNQFNNTFGSYVKDLQNLKLPTIPERIDMVGRHTVQVNISATEFEKIEENFRDMILEEINKQMKPIRDATGGALGGSGYNSRLV